MRIGIDARFYGLHHAGIGRYAINLIRNLAKIDTKNEYVLFANDDNKFDDLPKNFSVVRRNTPHYSLKEQIVLPKVIKENNLDLMHFPHYNVAILNFKTPFVVTIFDLIKHKYPESTKATGLGRIKSLVNRVGYKAIMNWGVKKSRAVITGAESVKDELVKLYKIEPEKVHAIKLAVDDYVVHSSNNNKDEVLSKYDITSEYLLYVGNAYRYKNVDFLIKSATNLPSDIKLVLVGARGVFKERLLNFIDDNNASDKVIVAGFVPDEDLQVLYQNALAFVSASLIEGFGLPPLEAMANGCPTILSDIPVHKEMCGDASLYFDLLSKDDLLNQVNRLVNDESLRTQLIKKSKQQVDRYSWEDTVKKTIEVYESVL